MSKSPNNNRLSSTIQTLLNLGHSHLSKLGICDRSSAVRADSRTATSVWAFRLAWTQQPAVPYILLRAHTLRLSSWSVNIGSVMTLSMLVGADHRHRALFRLDIRCTLFQGWLDLPKENKGGRKGTALVPSLFAHRRQ